MRAPLKVLRRTSLEQDRCQAVILDVLAGSPVVDLEIVRSEALWVARGFVRSPRFAPKIPRRGASCAIAVSRADGATCIELSCEETRELKDWEKRFGGLATLVAAAPLPLLLVAGPQGILPLLFAIGAVSLSAMLFLGLLTVAKDVLTSRRKELEGKLWRALEQAGPTGLLRSKDPEQTASLTLNVGVASVLLFPLLLALWALGFRRFAAGAAAFFLIPLLLSLAAGLLAEKLPPRFQWRTRRIYISFSWFGAMFLPLPLVLGAGSDKVLAVPVLADVIHWFGPFLVFAGYVLFLQSMHKSIVSTERRYGGLLLNPTRGYEEVRAEPRILAYHQTAMFSLYLLLSAGTYACGLIVVREWRSRPGITVLDVVLFGPFLLTVVFWVGRNVRRAVTRLRLGAVPGEGRELLDRVVRPGLSEEIRAALGGRNVTVAWGTGLGFGAALLRCGLGKPRDLLLLDRLTLSVVRDARQREAMVWHEVAHSFSPGWLRPLFEALFGVWGEQVRTLLLDSVQEEIACDAYVSDVRGLGRELLQALEAIERSGIGERKRPPEGVAKGFQALFRLITGEEQLDDWHPHFKIRISELRHRLAKDSAEPRLRPAP